MLRRHNSHVFLWTTVWHWILTSHELLDLDVRSRGNLCSIIQGRSVMAFRTAIINREQASRKLEEPSSKSAWPDNQGPNYQNRRRRGPISSNIGSAQLFPPSIPKSSNPSKMLVTHTLGGRSTPGIYRSLRHSWSPSSSRPTRGDLVSCEFP